MGWNYELTKKLFSIVYWKNRIKEEPPTDEELLFYVVDESGDNPWDYITSGWYAGDNIYISHDERISGVVLWARMPKNACGKAGLLDLFERKNENEE